MQQVEKLTGYPSIDKPWLKYYSEKAINEHVPECSVFENIYQHNKIYKNDVAIIFFGRKITYKQLFREVGKVVKALLSYGVEESDNVVLCTLAVPEAIYFILALNCIGANAIMLNPTFTEKQLLERTRETDAKVLFIVNELYQCMENVISQTKIEMIISCPALNSLGTLTRAAKRVWKTAIPGTKSWKEFISHGNKTTVGHELTYKVMRPAIMVYSSGTTGASKGIQLTNDGINATILQYQYAGFHMKRQDRYFSQVPIWFSTGISVTMLVPLCLGVTIILEPVYDFGLFYKHIIKYHPNFMVTAVGLLEYLQNNHKITSAYADFKYLVAGGEYVAPVVEKKMNKWLSENSVPDRLHKGWGMCECGGTITTTISDCNKIGSAGIPLPQVIVNAFSINTDQPLKYGERGELRVQTPCRMLEYYKNTVATNSYFWRDDEGKIWACTGDMGYVDRDGVVFVDGRISESYVDKEGQVIYLFDIERAILSIDTVQQCKAVTGVIENTITHIIHIVAKEKQGDVLKKIKDICRAMLPPNHMPRYFRFYEDALPVAPSGKLNTELMKKETFNLIEI